MDIIAQKHIEQQIKKQNNQTIHEFENYSSLEMHLILYSTFETDSPVKLQKLTNSEYSKIPILNQIRYLANLIDKENGIKLTPKGYLPTKIVATIYKQGFLQDYFIERGITKLYKESDSMTVNLTRILIELTGLVKKRKQTLSLTKQARKVLENNTDLLRLVLQTFTTKFNWAYFDNYGQNNIAQLGYGFSLILLAKYGVKKRLSSFYAEKYFKAYPQLLEYVVPTYGNTKTYTEKCYSLRTFERFLVYFGLITIEQEGKSPYEKHYITKTDLFDKLIQCIPHKNKTITINNSSIKQ